MLLTKLILADSNPDSRQMMTRALNKTGRYEVLPIKQPIEIAEALNQSHENLPEAILMDVTQQMDKVHQAIQHLQKRFPCLPVIALTDYGNMKQVQLALQEGAVDYLPRPVSHQRLELTINNIVARYRLAQEISCMRYFHAARHQGEYLPARNPRMQRLLKQVLVTGGPILLSGEKGTGKEILARNLHLYNKDKYSPFVAINCYPLAEIQLWSILFGTSQSNEKGAKLSSKLSGALGGTLFINGIETLSHEAQDCLIEQLEKMESNALTASDKIRLMAAARLPANNIWQAEELSPRFRKYISGNISNLPPLRRSLKDIGQLAEYFAQRFAVQEKPYIQGITPAAIALLEKYDWPENVAELERIIFRTVLTCEDSQIDVEHLMPYMPASLAPELEGASHSAITRSGKMPITNNQGEIRRLRDLEADMIQFAINYYNGQISEVARKLGIGRSTLYRKLHDLDIKVA